MPLSSAILRTRMTWYAMIRRCTVASATDYERYGGRGISVCSRWLESFDNFVEDMGVRPEGKGKDKWTIDRIDGDGNYERGNCRWATPKMQNNDPKRLAKTSAVMRKRWADPGYRESITASLSGNTNSLGYKHTPEAKAKIGEASKGREQSAEQRAKIGNSKIGNTYKLGKAMSVEARAKISAARRAEWADPVMRAKRMAARSSSAA